MIRPITSNDTSALIALMVATGLFKSKETEEIAQMLANHFDGHGNSPDLWLTDDDNGPIAIAYVAPERMTEGTWNLYLIAIHPEHQRMGRGSTMLAHIEQILAERGERLLLVETSGLDSFDYVRVFYQKNGYKEEARIREFYKTGEDKVVFCKYLTTS